MNKKFGDETKRSEPGSVSRRTLMATASAAASGALFPRSVQASWSMVHERCGTSRAVRQTV
jgi:hypothetical protein